MGAGLAVLTGIRAFLPIAFVALYSRLEFRSSPDLESTVFAFLEKTWVIALLFALAVIEIVAEKIWVVNKTRDQAMQPIRIALGGLVFAVAMAPDGWIAMVVAAVFGLVIAGLADHVRRSTRLAPTTETTSLRLVSAYEDIVVLIGTLLFVLVPLIGVLVFCFLGLLVYRVQVVRKRKHKGLRILK
jgi:uncharacterized membrane protein